MGTKEIIEIAESGLKYQIDNGKSDFVIYPFGAYGKLVKYILNSMGVQERMIVDNKKYVEDENIHSVDELRELYNTQKSFDILLCIQPDTKNIEIYR